MLINHRDIPQWQYHRRSARRVPASRISDETLLHVEIDLDEIVRGKFDFLHHRRLDVFQLTADDRTNRTVASLIATP